MYGGTRKVSASEIASLRPATLSTSHDVDTSLGQLEATPSRVTWHGADASCSVEDRSLSESTL
jgi:hypothetical protein